MTLPRAEIDLFAEWGIRAFTTRREAGTFSVQSDEPARDVSARWRALQSMLAGPARRLASAQQVHGARVVDHRPGWEGWLRIPGADGHLALERGTAMAISVADCVPVFIAHPSGAIALVHSGWRGTEAGITERAIAMLAAGGRAPDQLRIYLGPAICGRCYEVSPDVHARLTGRAVDGPTPVDLRAVITDRARSVGARDITIADDCTRCHNDRFFSHRAGDRGRQLAVMVAE